MPAPMSDAELDGVSKEVVDWYIRWNPSFATHAGIHEYDHLVPPATYEAEFEERSHVKAFLRQLEGIDLKTLSHSKRVASNEVHAGDLRAQDEGVAAAARRRRLKGGASGSIP